MNFSHSKHPDFPTHAFELYRDVKLPRKGEYWNYTLSKGHTERCCPPFSELPDDYESCFLPHQECM